MNTTEIIISFIFAFGIGSILYLILRDPVLMFKSLLRGLKFDRDFTLKIAFSPIWAPIWLIDKLFNLKLYIKNFEDASQPKSIKFTEYDKYIKVDTDDAYFIEGIVKAFYKAYDPNDYNHRLNGAVIKLARQNNYSLIKFEKDVDFNSFHAFIQYMDNSAPQNKVFHVKGVLINRQNRSDSYFCFVDTAFPLKLIGKTYRNKKMYVDYDPEKKENAKIYLNSNIDYFKNFNFDKFESDLISLEFRKLN